MRVYYKDFVTGKRHFTRARPIKAMRAGICNTWGLVLQSKSFITFIPEYLLEPKGRAILEKKKQTLTLPSGEQG